MATRADTSNVVPLKYVARAGLLPELTRQTYDSLYKALREVILNSVDAGARHITIDLSAVATARTMEVIDDGTGMTLEELQQAFMSLGGSQKFGTSDKFGRIGIGSLALMHYAQSVEVQTTKPGSTSVTKAVITHPWALDQAQRTQDIGDFLAGEAWEEKRSTAASAHYTIIRLHGVDEVLLGECADIGAYYKLIDRLRRILPLPWVESTLSSQLEEVAPDLVALIREHTREFQAHVVVRSQWSSDELLLKRIYGDGLAQEEEWNGKPHSILKDIPVDDDSTTRVVRVAGYLLSQVRPSIDWTGLTARVQNVAVEERSFFDLETDPGFRKYITGEVWLLGEVDRGRLINIDRTSFNRESADYRVVARVMQAEIARFKAERVQAPQRAKVAIKRRLDEQIAVIGVAARLGAAVSRVSHSGSDRAAGGLPSSGNGSMRPACSRNLLDDLQKLGAIVVLGPDHPPHKQPYKLRIASDGQHILVEARTDLAHPAIAVGDRLYNLSLIEGRATDPPIIVKNRPREILVNLAHEVFEGRIHPAAFETIMALEFAYLLGAIRDADELYNRVLTLLAPSQAARMRPSLGK